MCNGLGQIYRAFILGKRLVASVKHKSELSNIETKVILANLRKAENGGTLVLGGKTEARSFPF